MSLLEDPFDVLWSQQDHCPFELPTFGMLDEVFLSNSEDHHEGSDTHSHITKGENDYCSEVTEEETMKSSQSDLHNCPKHLIKFVIQTLGLPNSACLETDQFASLPQETRRCLGGLLNILQLCSKGKIKSLSKELLKVIFEEGSEHNHKLKLLQNPNIKKVFQDTDSSQMNQAKALLRRFTIQKLQKGKTGFVDRSRIVRKGVNQRYLEMFVEQLKTGRVKERVSKQDKEWILQVKNF